jgi:ATP-binding cassette subfamily B (MDR/TAP) protein 1
MKDQTNKKAHEESAQLACEAAGAIRTVASLTREEDFHNNYSRSLEVPLQRSNRTALWGNWLYAISQGTSFFAIALVCLFPFSFSSLLFYTSDPDFAYIIGVLVWFSIGC